MQDVTVDLPPGQREPVLAALAERGFAPAGEAPWARVMVAGEGTFEDAAPIVRWVLDGGVLAICGGEGPLLAALNLTPGEVPGEGPLRPVAPGLPEIGLPQAPVVTGVGFALYRDRTGERCVAIAGPRGAGWVVYTAVADPGLLAACLDFVRARSRRAGG